MNMKEPDEWENDWEGWGQDYEEESSFWNEYSDIEMMLDLE